MILIQTVIFNVDPDERSPPHSHHYVSPSSLCFRSNLWNKEQPKLFPGKGAQTYGSEGPGEGNPEMEEGKEMDG